MDAFILISSSSHCF